MSKSKSNYQSLRKEYYFYYGYNLFNNLQTNLAVQPNHEKPGGPNSPTNIKLFLSSFEYNLLNKHVEHFDQQMGASHYLLGNKDVKIIKKTVLSY